MLYLVHFEKKLSHAQHYLGSVANHSHLERRMHEHRTGRGARILDACNRAGIPYRVVRTMNGGRIKERRLKNRKNGPKICPICNPSINQQQPKP